MAFKALWALHFERNKNDRNRSWACRFYELADLEKHLDRPYAPHSIDVDTLPGNWGLVDSTTGKILYHDLCEPVEINEDNLITVFNFSEGHMGRARENMKSFAQKKDLSRSSGSSP